ncbi:hypothetical protein SCP_0904420 [Sparassis crispa]|uniref:BTB domain-containing protein n=1 Tax=Sparassis crispa TaxID=139825 RepID=A0A401GWK8_9APHY|nr:hypothetical protein SCP_0904420 [Sparassis crispa]GBE86563.1 hypothetical protein SCP_0904420 [Sparassis crispa]
MDIPSSDGIPLSTTTQPFQRVLSLAVIETCIRCCQNGKSCTYKQYHQEVAQSGTSRSALKRCDRCKSTKQRCVRPGELEDKTLSRKRLTVDHSDLIPIKYPLKHTSVSTCAQAENSASSSTLVVGSDGEERRKKQSGTRKTLPTFTSGSQVKVKVTKKRSTTVGIQIQLDGKVVSTTAHPNTTASTSRGNPPALQHNASHTAPAIFSPSIPGPAEYACRSLGDTSTLASSPTAKHVATCFPNTSTVDVSVEDEHKKRLDDNTTLCIVSKASEELNPSPFAQAGLSTIRSASISASSTVVSETDEVTIADQNLPTEHPHVLERSATAQHSRSTQVSDTKHAKHVQSLDTANADIRPAKRARRETTSTFTQCARHPVFWHVDGSVILQVENTLFKLHRSRLAQDSSYFADLFNNSSSRNSKSPDDSPIKGISKTDDLERDFMDGCLVYKMPDDVSVDDFANLMTALENAIAYTFKPPSFSVLASTLRAAHALSFSKIVEFAIHFLRPMWPSDLSLLSPERKPHAAEMVVLAQKCALPEMLKRAYYELLRTPHFSQWEDSDEDMYADDAAEARGHHHLSNADLMRLIIAREKLQRTWLHIACKALDPSTLRCSLSQTEGGRPVLLRCRVARGESLESWTVAIKQEPVLEEGMFDTICALQKLIDMEWGKLGYCTGCIDARKEMWKAQKEKLWRDLDVWLDVRTVTSSGVLQPLSEEVIYKFQ